MIRNYLLVSIRPFDFNVGYRLRVFFVVVPRRRLSRKTSSDRTNIYALIPLNPISFTIMVYKCDTPDNCIMTLLVKTTMSQPDGRYAYYDCKLVVQEGFLKEKLALTDY